MTQQFDPDNQCYGCGAHLSGPCSPGCEFSGEYVPQRCVWCGETGNREQGPIVMDIHDLVPYHLDCLEAQVSGALATQRDKQAD